MIKFENITKIYPPNIVALEDVNFEVQKGEFVLIVGRSGAGKTTLIKLLLREEEPTKGKIFFEGEDVFSIPKKRLPSYRQKIGVIFQDYKLLTTKNVYENVAYAMEVMGAQEAEIKRDVPKVLELVGLEDKAYNFPAELSGGEKQRTAIARALIVRPEVLVADEPTGNLDPYHTKDIIELLQKINSFGTTIILATHDRAIVNSLEKRVITLEKGKIIRDEEKGELLF
ncbi:cell division ATP-binding protein FtsE [bacterium]|nr:cell division ATP-binding protein FtsE [bacterium]